MPSISGIADRNAAAVGNGVAVAPLHVRQIAGRWLMFSDSGPMAQRHMATVWSCILGCALVDAVWLPSSRLSLAASNWAGILQAVMYCALASAFIAVVSRRLRSDQSRLADALRRALLVAELMWRATLPIASLLTAGAILSYLITAANLPLRDSLLAGFDQALGFDWPGFLAATNSDPLLAKLLTWAYRTTGPIAELAIIWLALHRQDERLAEFIAVLSLSAAALCAVMWIVPAAGAFAFYDPAPKLFGNYAMQGDMWPFAAAFFMLRSGTLSMIDSSALQGIVSFPSFHTMLGVMTIHAVRDTRWLRISTLVLNGTMFVSTLTVGGHHLADVLAGAGLTVAAIFVVRR